MCKYKTVLLLTGASLVSPNSSLVYRPVAPGPPGPGSAGHGVHSTVGRAGLTPLLPSFTFVPGWRQSPSVSTATAVVKLN